MKKLVYISLFITGLGNVQAQDLHFSQFPHSPLNFNPAEAGNSAGDLRINGLHRRQWNSVPVPYISFAMGADVKLFPLTGLMRGFNAGLQVNHDKAGDGNLQQLDFAFSLNKNFYLSEDSVHSVRAGISAGFSQRSIDFNSMTYDAQWNGDVFNPDLPRGENGTSERKGYFDLGAGAGYTYLQENRRISAGFALFHLNKPDQSFYNDGKAELPQLMRIYSMAEIGMNDIISIMPAVMFSSQEKFREFVIGSEIKYILKTEGRKGYAAGAGLFLRTGDAVIPMVSVYVNKFRFGISYDINISEFNSATRSKGGPEFSITYLTRKIRTETQRTRLCPVY